MSPEQIELLKYAHTVVFYENENTRTDESPEGIHAWWLDEVETLINPNHNESCGAV